MEIKKPSTNGREGNYSNLLGCIYILISITWNSRRILKYIVS
jgi:hypothetical protein